MDERGWQTVAWGVAAIVAVVLGVRLLAGGDSAAPPVKIAGSYGAGARAERRSPKPALYVHVAGAVRRPGLYRVAEGARVAVALDRAGGPTPAADLTGVNLAATLEDGQQVVVPSAVARGAAGVSGQAAISLAGATVEQLEELDGIGPTLAERIVEHRQASGGLSSLDQLGEVEGIGEQRLEALKEALTP